MDRYSDDGIVSTEVGTEIKSVPTNKESKTLKTIDDKIMTIDEILNNIENKEGEKK